MAVRSSGTPGPGGHWLPRPSRRARTAASRTASGPSVSGKPWPRLMDPVRWARADISAKIVVPNSARRRLRRGRALEVMTAILRATSGVAQVCFGCRWTGAFPHHAGQRGTAARKDGGGMDIAIEMGILALVLLIFAC